MNTKKKRLTQAGAVHLIELWVDRRLNRLDPDHRAAWLKRLNSRDISKLPADIRSQLELTAQMIRAVETKEFVKNPKK